MPRPDLPPDDVPGDQVAGNQVSGDEVASPEDAAVIERVSRIAAEMDDADGALVEPPPELWDRIAAASASVESDGSPVVVLDERRRRMNRSIVVAVAASVLLFVAMGVLFTRGGSSPDPQVVATAVLEPVDGVDVGDAGADVRLVENGDDRRLVLSAHDMAAAPPGQHYELWLLDPDEGEPVSLGDMGGSVSVPVPADVDLDAYDVVDVSIQAEGETEHSGNSILRGTLA